MPRHGKTRQRTLLNRLDLLAQPRERALPQRAQYAGVDPLAAMSAGTELALDDGPDHRELAERALHERWADAEATREVADRERTVGARVAASERGKWPRLADEERIRKALRHHGAERVPVFRGVLGGDEARFVRDVHVHDAALPRQILEPFVNVRAHDRARGDLVAREVAEAKQELVHAIRVLRVTLGIEVLQLQLELGEHVGVEELAQLRLAEQLSQLQRIDGERLRAALGEWRVALIDEVADVLEEQRRGERRRRARVDGHDADVAAADLA